jgi:hypothetical protein
MNLAILKYTLVGVMLFALVTAWRDDARARDSLVRIASPYASRLLIEREAFVAVGKNAMRVRQAMVVSADDPPPTGGFIKVGEPPWYDFSVLSKIPVSEWPGGPPCDHDITLESKYARWFYQGSCYATDEERLAHYERTGQYASALNLRKAMENKQRFREAYERAFKTPPEEKPEASPPAYRMPTPRAPVDAPPRHKLEI